MIIEFNLNGKSLSLDVEPSKRVIDLLREDLQLTGTKEGCGAGECGACAIIVNGKAMLSCLMLTLQLQGSEVITIEGIKGQGLNPTQQSFVEEGAVQCGFCTPGMIMSVEALLRETISPSVEEIRAALSGNLCRCTGYKKIIEAAKKSHEDNR